jgi:hypothetical protein
MIPTQFVTQAINAVVQPLVKTLVQIAQQRTVLNKTSFVTEQLMNVYGLNRVPVDEIPRLFPDVSCFLCAIFNQFPNTFRTTINSTIRFMLPPLQVMDTCRY